MKLHRKRIKNTVAVLSLATLLVAAAGNDIRVFAAKDATVQKIENAEKALQNEIDAIDSQLVDLLSEIDVLQQQIAENEASIAEMQEELAIAQEAEQTQYYNMKKRLQYLYENGEPDILSVLLESGSVTDFLNQLEYTNSIVEYDRSLLDSYEATRIDIEEMTLELQEEQLQLQSQQSQLSAKQASLDSLLSAKKAQMVDYEKQLKAAKEAAAKRAAEAAAKAAAKRAAENAAAVRAASSSGSSSGSADNASGVSGGSNPAGTTGISGSSVVAYANQFVGNPYVFGGNSLTNGCDCSGFVVQVYANFGINLSGSRNSAALRSVGQAVSYEYMQPGDIVCYAGHVGIYTGSGTIVEAQSSRAGITNNRSVTCKKILAIRRVI